MSMFNVYKSRDTNGVTLSGDFFDFDRLYFAITKFTGNYGDKIPSAFENCSAVCENLLGLCYEIRHAWQGDRGIEQVYNGIQEYWFDDYKESDIRILDDDEEDEDDEDDDEYSFEEEGTNDDSMFAVRFSRSDFPEIGAQNAYFTVTLSFPEIILYALLLSALLDKKDSFLQIVKNYKEQEPMLQELYDDYRYFDAEIDIARITILVKKIFQSLYHFIGEKDYFSFMTEFKRIDDFSVECDLEKINQTIVDYNEKEYDQDDPEIIKRVLFSFLK